MSWPSMRMRPAVGCLEAGQHAQERGLAAAGTAEQGEQFALLDGEGDVVDGGEAAELLGHALDAEEGLRRRPRPSDVTRS